MKPEPTKCSSCGRAIGFSSIVAAQLGVGRFQCALGAIDYSVVDDTWTYEEIDAMIPLYYCGSCPMAG